ncbi:Obg-like ATPase 1 [Wickerhamiella sorbophila]|uniref:Obg-like ATPase homolog n=1 Tax=Wickerhamiella sorbophila TaxID=45607 RepID=A0A2T0FJY7_9ASCO|nr:Obg-like ATPase 1 [Wickerhamiella sorbophila]PRT55289.1 Obg-like ATPase 1 [Wickerhamiella sorbophila]
MSRQIIGRAKTNLSAGIVGLANVGKSTFFQAVSKTALGNPANYPFATIEPEESVVVVPSERLLTLKNLYNPRSVVPATLQLVDIAGLVKGASQGSGLGNAFLSHIRATDGLFQMVRAFDDSDIVHIEKSVDPVRDAQIIHDELVLKDMEFVQSAIDTTVKALKNPMNLKEKKEFLSTAEEVMEILESGKRAATKDNWTDLQLGHLRTLSLITTKPNVFIANISEEDYCFGDSESAVNDLVEWVKTHSPGDKVIPLSVNFEHRRSLMSPEEILKENEELGDIPSAIPAAISAMRSELGLHSFFTAGTDEVREWTIRVGTTAPQAAGAIHTDLEKTFIVANVTKLNDLVKYSADEAQIKRAGKLLSKGKDYVVEDGDIIHFRSGASKK